MSHAEHAVGMLDKLAADLGEAKPVWKSGACVLPIEGRELSFFYGEKESALFVQADLGPLSALPDQEAALITLLQANHLWSGTAGGAFGLYEGRIFYVFRLNFPLPADWEKHDEELLPELLPHILGALNAAEDRLRKVPGYDGPARPAEPELLRV